MELALGSNEISLGLQALCLNLFYLRQGTDNVVQVGLEVLIFLQMWSMQPALVRFNNHPRL